MLNMPAKASAFLLVTALWATGCHDAPHGASQGAAPRSEGGASPFRQPPGPDPSAVCAAALAAGSDPWTRFENVVPVYLGGWLYLLHGDDAAAKRALEPFGLRGVVVVDCPASLLVAWLPGVDDAPDGRLKAAFVKAFEAQGVQRQDRVVFSPSDGDERRRRRCVDPITCCEVLELHCRYRATTDAQMRACVSQGKSQAQTTVDLAVDCQ